MLPRHPSTNGGDGSLRTVNAEQCTGVHKSFSFEFLRNQERVVMSNQPKNKSKENKINWSYWGPTIGLCGSLIFNSLRVFFSTSGLEESIKMSMALNVPLFLGTFVVPIGSFVAAIIMLSNWNPTLRTFAYAWTLFYFVLELMLVINIKDNALIAWSVFNVLTWVSAYIQNQKRIAMQNLERLAKGLLAAAAIGTAVAS